MPNLFRLKGYNIYFWSNENSEPIHVHVNKGGPKQNATKIWLSSSGGCVIANNNSRIPEKDLNDLVDIIQGQFFYICNAWKEHFSTDKINFYC